MRRLRLLTIALTTALAAGALLTGCASAAPEEARIGGRGMELHLRRRRDLHRGRGAHADHRARLRGRRCSWSSGSARSGSTPTAPIAERRRTPGGRLRRHRDPRGGVGQDRRREGGGARDPDLIVGDWWPAEKAYSGLEDGVEETSKKIAELAPVVGAGPGRLDRRADRGLRRAGRARSARTPRCIDEAGSRVRRGRRGVLGRRRRQARPDRARHQPVRRHVRGGRARVRARAARLPALGPRRDRPDDARPRLPLLGDASASRTPTRTSRTCCSSTTATTRATERCSPSSRSPRSIRAYAAGAYTTWPAYWLHTYRDYAEQLARPEHEFVDGADENLARMMSGVADGAAPAVAGGARGRQPRAAWPRARAGRRAASASRSCSASRGRSRPRGTGPDPASPSSSTCGCRAPCSGC